MKLLPSLAMATILTCSTLAAAGDVPPDPNARGYREALQRFSDGTRSFQAGDFEAARLSFMQAYVIYPKAPNLLWNLAVAEVKSHHGVEGAAHLRQYLQLSTTTAAPDRAKAQQYLETALLETGHIVITAAPGTALSVDGESLKDPPAGPMDVEPGTHRIEGHLGALAKGVTVAPHAGETVTADLRVAQAPVVAQARPAPEPSTSPPVALPAASPISASPPPAAAPTADSSGGFFTPRNTLALGLGAAGAVALAVGVGFEIGRGHEQSRADAMASQLPDANACGNGTTAVSQCTQLQDANRSALNDKSMAIGTLVAGGAALAASAAVLVLWPSGSESRTGWVVPVVGPTVTGFLWRRTF